MDALYLETNSVIQQVHQRVAQLENVNDQAAAATLESAIVQQLETVASNCDKLDLMCENQPVNRKKYAKQLVEQLRYDCDHVKVALSVIQNRLLMDWKKKNEREELLSRRFTPNEATCIYLDDAAAVHNSKLRSVHKNVDSMIDTGRSVLENLRNQGFSLKGIRTKVLDIGNHLGLSGTVMRFIERRSDEDMKILFVGMLVTLLIMYLFYRLWRG
uniref:Golgi SNAP receptor complex member 2 n=1 Tax=Trichuris muris TaxID=70415 RepID=A0A5S6QYJ3_TRIMR